MKVTQVLISAVTSVASIFISRPLPAVTIVKNTQMTVWTDPNYGQTSSLDNYGLYQPRSGVATTVDNAQIVGRLEFVGENVQLNVGDNSYTTSEAGTHYNSATLAVVPYILFDFLGTGQGVTVNGNSYFQYYGLNETHGSTAILATPFTDGTSSGYGGGTITLTGLYPSALGSIEVPAFLEVHGGADFYTGKQGKLVSNYGQIDVLWEPNIYPINSGGVLAPPNSLVTGHMTLRGQTTLTNTSIYGYDPAWDASFASPPVILTVDDGFSTAVDPTATYQFLATNCTFANNPNTVTSEIQFGHSRSSTFDPCFWNSTIDGGSVTAVRVHAIDPAYGCRFLIENASFDHIVKLDYDMDEEINNCIYVENDQDPTMTQYGSVVIHNNTFGDLTYYGDNSRMELDPIYLRGFDDPATGPSSERLFYDSIIVSGNTLTNSNPHMDASAAITLENTSAFVLDNTISDPAYPVGINVIGVKLGSTTPPTTYSLICSNIIGGSGMFDCIVSDYYSGYVKLNSLGLSSVDYSSNTSDHPHLIFNNLSDYTQSWLFLENDAIVDMSGVHGPSDDYAAYNTITGPSYSSSSTSAQPITIYSQYSDVLMGKQISSWINFGLNNIIVTANDPGYSSKISSPSGVVDVGNLDNNYWGPNVLPPSTSTACPCNWNSGVGYSSEVDAEGIVYSETSTSTIGQSTIPDGTVCGAGTGYSSKKGNVGVKVTGMDTLPNDCHSLYILSNNYADNFEWQMCYDSAKKFIDTYPNCAMSWRAFLLMQEAVPHLWNSSDTALRTQYRRWLESVLYLNTTDPEYFCICVESISGAFYSVDTTTELLFQATNRGLAVVQWLLQHTGCDTAALRSEYTGGRRGEWMTWINDTTVKLDTTLPSMHDLGLDSILQIHLRMSVSEPTLFTGILQAFSLSENPFQSNTMLRFNLNSMAYVRTEVYDELGRMVIGDGSGKVYESGPHQLPIDLSKFASGAYYVRISLADGEARTLKLVKQQ